jgi:hypothetical protein
LQGSSKFRGTATMVGVMVLIFALAVVDDGKQFYNTEISAGS